MSEKSKRIIYWGLTGLISAVFLFSASSKLSGNAEAIKMAESFHLDAKTLMWIGVLEVICLALFVIPRTGILGTLLLSAYMGGAIATHLVNGMSIVAPCIIQAVVFFVAIYRFPELRTRFFNTQP